MAVTTTKTMRSQGWRGAPAKGSDAEERRHGLRRSSRCGLCCKDDQIEFLSRIVCVIANSESVLNRVPGPERVGALYDVTELVPRPGQRGMLYWSEQTQVRFRLSAAQYSHMAFLDSYDTYAAIQLASLNAYLSPIVKVVSVETKWTSTAKPDPYLEIYASDRDGQYLGPMRLWRFNDGVISAGKTCHAILWWVTLPQLVGQDARGTR